MQLLGRGVHGPHDPHADGNAMAVCEPPGTFGKTRVRRPIFVVVGAPPRGTATAGRVIVPTAAAQGAGEEFRGPLHGVDARLLAPELAVAVGGAFVERP